MVKTKRIKCLETKFIIFHNKTLRERDIQKKKTVTFIESIGIRNYLPVDY